MAEENKYQGLTALHYWLFDFPQLESYRNQDDNNNDVSVDNIFTDFDNLDIVNKIINIAEEICDCYADDDKAPTTVGEAWSIIHNLVREKGLLSTNDGDVNNNVDKDCQYNILCALLCHAVSDNCKGKKSYVNGLMSMGRPDLLQDIMAIIQGNNSGGSSDVEDTGDYSAFMEASVASLSETFEEYESDNNKDDDIDMKGNNSGKVDNGDEEEMVSDSPQGKRLFEESRDDSSSNHQSQSSKGDGAEDNLRATIAKLQQELKASRQQEANLAIKNDEDQSNHRAEMLQVESKHLKTMRDIEDKYINEVSEQKRELENLRDYKQSAKELKEENSKLRDELDVLECSKEKLSYTEEQLRKCRDKIELIGDAHDALQREEKAHASSVDKCLSLENELAQLKPLKRQLEEYRVRATDAEVALAECREDLRRIKEKSSGLEGANRELKSRADMHQTEAGNMQKRLQEEGGKSDKAGIAVGVGMSELNPELMEELKTLRSEYARLKEFESKREVDSVQRLEESCDDAKRLSERFKEQFFQTKSQLEDTQQLLSESEARETKLKEEVEDLTKKYKLLGNEMKEERLKSHKAALDAERSYQNEKKSLIEKGRQDLQDLEEKLTAKIESERNQHKEKMERAEVQRTEMENNLSQQLAQLREHSSKTLRSTKEQAQKDMDDLEQSKQEEIEKLLKDKADEIEALTTKGKGMIRESRKKSKELERQIKEDYEVKISSLKDENKQLTTHQLEYERVASNKIEKRDKQIQLLEAKDREAARTNDALQDKVRKADRKNKELGSDNDRLRRQLGSRGPGGASQGQVDELTAVCKSLQEENRRLKEMNPDRHIFSATRDTAPEPSPGSDNGGRTSFSKNTLTQFREEYEEKIEQLEEEKRDLVLKSSAAASETSKAEQRSWKLEEELTKVRSELTTAKLALQRNERRTDFSAGLSSSSKRSKAKENTPNKKRKHDFTPKSVEPSSQKKMAAAVPSLMDHLQPKNDVDGSAPSECQQS